MGFAILEMFESGEEAKANLDRIAKDYGFSKDRLFIFDESDFPELWEDNKKFSVNLE